MSCYNKLMINNVHPQTRTRRRTPIQAHRRDLKRRFNQGVEPSFPLKRRVGARRWYVTIRRDTQVGILLGPYSSQIVAVANLKRGSELAIKNDPFAAFDQFIIASSPNTYKGVFGR
jgi:hypothetical protein